MFSYDYTDLQVEQVIGGGVNVENADAEVLGAELDLLYLATEELVLNAGISLLDTEYTEFVTQDTIAAPGVDQDLSGNELSRAPEWSVTLGAEFERILDSGASFLFRADVLFSDSYTTREFNLSEDGQDSYENVNAIASYTTADESWTFFIWGKNLTDETVLLSTFNPGPIPPGFEVVLTICRGPMAPT